MKLFCFFVLFFKDGVNLVTGEHVKAPLSGKVHLWLTFDPYYNDVVKTCYKFVQDNWVIIVDTTGFINGAYRGRVKIEQYNGGIDVRIQDLRLQDAGMYRCRFQGISLYYFYKDFQVFVSEAERKPEPDPALLLPKSTPSSVTLVYRISEKHREPPSDSWSLKHTLGTVFGTIVILLIIGVALGLVHHRKKARDPGCGTSLDECGKSRSSPPDVIPQPPQEVNSIIYTTVEFKPFEETSEVYANLSLHNSRAIGPDPGGALKSHESVEYSTIGRIL